jgi:hypothetical protein
MVVMALEKEGGFSINQQGYIHINKGRLISTRVLKKWSY